MPKRPRLAKALERAKAKSAKAMAANRTPRKPGSVAGSRKVSATNLRGKVRLPETEEGTVLFNTDPIILKYHYEIEYIHSYAQDSPFFRGLAEGKFLGSRCTRCRTDFPTPRGHCMECGAPTKWFPLPNDAVVHTWTTCYFGSQAFLHETPFNLVLLEWPGLSNTLFLARLIGVTQDQIHIGMKVRAQYRRNSKFTVTDVYFVPAE